MKYKLLCVTCSFARIEAWVEWWVQKVEKQRHAADKWQIWDQQGKSSSFSLMKTMKCKKLFYEPCCEILKNCKRQLEVSEVKLQQMHQPDIPPWNSDTADTLRIVRNMMNLQLCFPSAQKTCCIHLRGIRQWNSMSFWKMRMVIKNYSFLLSIASPFKWKSCYARLKFWLHCKYFCTWERSRGTMTFKHCVTGSVCPA